jgi:DNA invertase Pin-like site-specific DNA recombinase
MVIAFLRGKIRDYSISYQQEFILEYAQRNAIAIEMTELDNSLPAASLEDREVLLTLLKSLKPNDSLLVYDIASFSKKVGELAKVFDCILKHDINVHICKQNLIINNQTSSALLMSILSTQREKNIKKESASIGRPKGSFSKSKFDKYKLEIVKMLEENLSVSEIAKRLGVSRSSLKDYINSRSLKEIVDLQNNAGNVQVNLNIVEVEHSKKCPLTNS